MKNYILGLKTSNSYVSKFEVAKINLLLLSKDNKMSKFESLRFCTGLRTKRNVVQ